MPSSRGDSQTTHTIIFTDSVSLLQQRTVKWEAQTGTCQCSTSTFKNCGCTALDMPRRRKRNKLTDRWAKQPSQVTCVSEDLKCCGHYQQAQSQDMTGGEIREKRKNSMSFLQRSREGHHQSDERWKELFQRQRWGNLWETGRIAHTHGLFRVHRYHLELNWSKLSWHILLLLQQFTVDLPSSTVTPVWNSPATDCRLAIRASFLPTCAPCESITKPVTVHLYSPLEERHLKRIS